MLKKIVSKSDEGQIEVAVSISFTVSNNYRKAFSRLKSNIVNLKKLPDNTLKAPDAREKQPTGTDLLSTNEFTTPTFIIQHIIFTI